MENAIPVAAGSLASQPDLERRVRLRVVNAVSAAFSEAAAWHREQQMREKNLFDNTGGQLGSLGVLHAHLDSAERFEGLAAAIDLQTYGARRPRILTRVLAGVLAELALWFHESIPSRCCPKCQSDSALYHPSWKAFIFLVRKTNAS